MNTFNTAIMRMAFLTSLLFTVNGFSADATTELVIPDHSIITGIQAVAKVTISGNDIQKSIADGDPLETAIIANACMFTTHPDGDYDLTISALEGKFQDGSDFALFNQSLGKVKTTLFVSSVEQPISVAVKPDQSKSLTDHSDNKASGTTCANQVRFNLSIAVDDLRTAKAGTYEFGFSASTTAYSG